MKLKKLLPELVAGIVDAGFEKAPREIQMICLPMIKSGADALIVAPMGTGKSITLVMGVIQQLKEAEGDSPRAMLLAETKEKAFALEEQIRLLGKYTNLRIFTAFEQGDLLYQKDTIYNGIDILIGTPKRLNELMQTAGFPVNQVKLFLVDDAERFYHIQQHQVIYRIAESIPKAQMILFANTWNEKFDLLAERIMKNPQIMEFDQA
ncbi:MAG: DEAD/DEAH box helicase [Prolixibacteraceae bacterium]|nr:DEAD/DEAH box helicase [Prolixibacteraceae bacterium]